MLTHSLFVVLMRINILVCITGHQPKGDDEIADVTNKPLWGSQRAAAGYHFQSGSFKALVAFAFFKSDSWPQVRFRREAGSLSFQHFRIEVVLARSISMKPTQEPVGGSEQGSGDPSKLDRPRVRWLEAGRLRGTLRPVTRGPQSQGSS